MRKKFVAALSQIDLQHNGLHEQEIGKKSMKVSFGVQMPADRFSKAYRFKCRDSIFACAGASQIANDEKPMYLGA